MNNVLEIGKSAACSFLSRVIETQSGKKLKSLFANIDNYFA